MLSKSTGQQHTIVIAEDDEDDRLMLKEALAELHFHHQVMFMRDGQDLLDYLNRVGRYTELRDQPLPSLILLDLNMPRKDGREALREIKQNPTLQRIPVVALTTSTAETDIFLSYEMGASAYITKPAGYAPFLAALATLMEYWFEVVRLPRSV